MAIKLKRNIKRDSSRNIKRQMIRKIDKFKGYTAIIEVNPSKPTLQFTKLHEKHKIMVKEGWITKVITDKATIIKSVKLHNKAINEKKQERATKES